LRWARRRGLVSGTTYVEAATASDTVIVMEPLETRDEPPNGTRPQ
jgi:hypothetical protein